MGLPSPEKLGAATTLWRMLRGGVGVKVAACETNRGRMTPPGMVAVGEAVGVELGVGVSVGEWVGVRVAVGAAGTGMGPQLVGLVPPQGLPSGLIQLMVTVLPVMSGPQMVKTWPEVELWGWAVTVLGLMV